ncbi:hypothetical protein BCR36DRAFT_300730 [Piromyces finnis]|uniref:G-protein coupled receptors family 3 profile domain-containing protein n=1 Tax=Piromyces finnis TaxID=1754191 RepID=A0A1Y1V189_9FUNG|nr:hypothetical protein BCR36DRAFT_300730 [Piromyces finnis]|eukprot:ORX44836.1 hypothetical protein BCR36DRAFT_300730 [Piromyces finnis]
MMHNNTFSNCHFDNGIIEVDTNNFINGNYYIENTNFYNNTSTKGPILNIKSFGKEDIKEESKKKLDDEEFTNNILIKNSVFKNNSASELGGVIYSISSNSNRYINFDHCEFINNIARIGNICFSLNKNSEPEFSNADIIKNMKGIATNPTKIALSDDYDIKINSGDKIPSGLSCKMYDDYNNEILFDTDISNFNINNMVSFNIETSDDYNVELYGQTKSYCWNDKCEFPSFKVIGNPGHNRRIKFTIVTFGKYNTFENNSIDLNFQIKECNSSYIYQYIDSPRLKSCYKPTCSPSCNNRGECVNMNVCNCEKTLFTGTYFGIMINLIYALLLTIEKSPLNCYSQYILSNIGFSLVFVTILVKLFRIYRIFCFHPGTVRIMKQSTTYIVIFSYISFYIIISIIFIFCNGIKLDLRLTDDFKEYKKCTLPKINILW